MTGKEICENCRSIVVNVEEVECENCPALKECEKFLRDLHVAEPWEIVGLMERNYE